MQSQANHTKSLDSYSAVQTSRLYQDVATQISAAIIRGDLRPGDRLPSAQVLTQQFGVSRVVIREAIQKLRHNGMLIARQGQGVFVTEPSVDVVVTALFAVLEYRRASALDLHQVREALEVEIAGLAAENASDEEKAALTNTLNSMKTVMNSLEEYVELDLVFHCSLAAATGNSEPEKLLAVC